SAMSTGMDAARFNRWFHEHEETITGSLVDYLSIDTVTPREADATAFLTEYLAGVGGTCDVLPVHPALTEHRMRSPHPQGRSTPERGSLRANLGNCASPSAPTTMFNAHVDVVPASPDFSDAFTPMLRDGAIWGRGAADTKNNLIMLVEAIRFLRDEQIPLARNVMVDLPAEEEIGGNGTLSNLLHGAPFDEAVCLEPTSLTVFRGHRGCLTFKVTVFGRSVHMGSAQTGVDAIAGAIAAIGRLRELESSMLTRAAEDPVFNVWARPLQLNIGLISGGEWSGSVPERCSFTGELGFLPPDSIADVQRAIEAACRHASGQGESVGMEVDFTAGLSNDSYLTDAGEALVHDLVMAQRSVVDGGTSAQPVGGWNVSCDARLYANVARVPTVVFGSGSVSDAHSAHEHVRISELAQGMAVLARFLSTGASVGGKRLQAPHGYSK
ncbi:MAG: M20/M25/M40 family metallo-hydrolase, partial [Actinomycetes bacterium]